MGSGGGSGPAAAMSGQAVSSSALVCTKFTRSLSWISGHRNLERRLRRAPAHQRLHSPAPSLLAAAQLRCQVHRVTTVSAAHLAARLWRPPPPPAAAAVAAAAHQMELINPAPKLYERKATRRRRLVGASRRSCSVHQLGRRCHAWPAAAMMATAGLCSCPLPCCSRQLMAARSGSPLIR